ncbi:hypothetical protein C3L33_09288, partial [Rhododendron williamsianum]
MRTVAPVGGGARAFATGLDAGPPLALAVLAFRYAVVHGGIDEISADIEKGIVIVIGDVDPVKVTCRIRKTGKIVDIISIGPPNKPEPDKDPENPEEIFPWSWAWPSCPPPCYHC